MERRRLQTQAGLVNNYYEDRQVSKGQELAQALGVISQGVNELGASRREKKEEQNLQNISFYAERARQANDGELVNLAKVKEIYPNLSDTVAGRVANDIGFKAGRDRALEWIKEMEKDPDLLMNEQLRNEKFAEFREALVDEVGDNPFYGQGYLASSDSIIAKANARWMEQQAAHDTAAQTETFGIKAYDLAAEGDIEGLMALDAEYDQTSSLSNAERKKSFQDTFIQLAQDELDPTILDQIPEKYINADFKKARKEAQKSIRAERSAKFSEEQRMKDAERLEQYNADRQAVIEAYENGTLESLRETLKDRPDSYEYAVRWLNNKQDLVTPKTSVIQMDKFSEAIFEYGTSTDADEAFKDFPNFLKMITKEDGTLDFSEQKIRNYIYGMNLTHSDMTKLLGKTKMLLDGKDFISDTYSKHQETMLNGDIDSFMQTIPASIAVKLRGVNYKSDLISAYRKSAQNGFTSYYEEHGEAPTGQAKREIYDAAFKFATDRLTNYKQGDFKRLEEDPHLQADPQVTPPASQTPPAPVTPAKEAGRFAYTPEATAVQPIVEPKSSTELEQQMLEMLKGNMQSGGDSK